MGKNFLSRNKSYYFRHPAFLLNLCDKKYFKSFFSKKMIPRACKCMFCGRTFHNFCLHGYVSELAEKHDVSLGPRLSDCPYCGSVDKYRWLWFVLKNYTDIAENKEGGEVASFCA